MSDFKRIEALLWCRANNADFNKPSPFPPPNGWMWAKSGETHVLTPLQTMTDQGEDITSDEVESLIVHVDYAFPEDCDHEWVLPDDVTEEENQAAEWSFEYCKKCGMSLIAYIFTEAP